MSAFSNIYTEKSKEMYMELFFMHWNRISTRYRLVHKFEYQNGYWEEKNGIGMSVVVSHTVIFR